MKHPTRRTLLASGTGLITSSLMPALAQPAKVGIAVTGYDAIYTHTFIAAKAGLFKKHGIDAEIINAQSGARIAQMIAAGQASYAMSGVIDAVRLTMSGKQAQILAGFDTRIPYANILIHKENAATIRTLADLQGQAIAITQPQTPMWLMATYLVEKSGGQGKVNIRAAGDFVSMLAVVKTKQVAATIATVSMMDSAVKEGWGAPLFDVSNDAAWQSAFGGPVPGTCCWALAKTGEEQKKQTQAVVRALCEAQDLVRRQDPEVTLDLIYEEYLRSLPREVALRNVQIYRDKFWSRDNVIDAAAYGRISSLMGNGRQYSDAELSTKASYAQMVDMSFVHAARGAPTK